MNKVMTLNLEQGMPTVADAIRRLEGELTALKRRGCRAVILIHGYGSTGTGGRIRAAVRSRLARTDLRGIVRTSAGGEEWASRKSELISACGALSAHRRQIEGNEGVTVVILG